MSVLSHINGPRGNGHNFLEENFPLTKIQQQAESRNLRIEIIDGLRSESRYLPSILQWDAEGLRLFEDITRSAAYYPTGAEIDILRSHADEMTKRVKSGSNVVELGGGCVNCPVSQKSAKLTGVGTCSRQEYSWKP